LFNSYVDDSGSLSTGAKIGIGIGAAVGAGIFISIALWICIKKKATIMKLRPNFNKGDLENNENPSTEIEEA